MNLKNTLTKMELLKKYQEEDERLIKESVKTNQLEKENRSKLLQKLSTLSTEELQNLIK